MTSVVGCSNLSRWCSSADLAHSMTLRHEAEIRMSMWPTVFAYSPGESFQHSTVFHHLHERTVVLERAVIWIRFHVNYAPPCLVSTYSIGLVTQRKIGINPSFISVLRKYWHPRAFGRIYGGVGLGYERCEVKYWLYVFMLRCKTDFRKRSHIHSFECSNVVSC